MRNVVKSPPELLHTL